MSWKIFSTKSVTETLMNRVKPLEEFGIEDAGFESISMKNLLNLFAIIIRL